MDAPSGGSGPQTPGTAHSGPVVSSYAVFIADEQSDIDVDTGRLRRLTAFVLADRQIPPAMEVSVLCVDTDAITALNRTHMGVDGPTDVLAFPLDAPGETMRGDIAILGDVVLCPAVAAAQAAEHGKTVQAETDLLVVHGLLHLLGHDHAEEGEKAVMFGLTDRLLADFPDEHPTGGRQMNIPPEAGR